jgi:hypothetical protein
MTPTRVAFVAFVSLCAGRGCTAPLHREELSIEEPVALLDVDVGSGDVEVIGADVTGASIVAQVEGDGNHLGYSLEDGRLTLFEECHQHPCGVNLFAIVPAPVPMQIHTGSGDVRVEGALDLLHVEAGSGDVAGFDVAGLDLAVQTGSGDIDLRVLEPAERVWLRAGSGDVQLAVPAGGYRLAIDTGSGDRSVQGIASDDAASASIDVDTGSGDVRIRGR